MRANGRDIDWHDLDALVRDKAARHGEREFLRIAGRALSYRDLELQSRRLANGLLALGVQKGDRVATFMFNRLEQVLTWFGAMRVGAVWTPLNAALAGADLAYTLEDAGARVLVAEAETLPQVEALPRRLLDALTVFVAGDAVGPHRRFDVLLAGEAPAGEWPRVDPGDPGLILYTGGTTGLPKGVVTPVLSAILAGVRYREAFDARPGECHFSTLPLFHAGAIQFGVMGPLVNDMRSVIDRRFSASEYWGRVRESGANIIDPIGAMVTLLCRQPSSDADRAHRVRVAIGIVNQIPDEVPGEFERRFGVPMVEIYGLTEAGGAMLTSNRLGIRRPGSNGQPHGWVELRIGDDADLPVSTGEVGEILLRPTFPHMFMLGYHNAPEKTLASLRGLWLHTGDLGRVDADGYLYFLGRKAHWIRRKGENISAYEIEEVLRRCPGVDEVVVVGVPSDIGEDDIKAFVIPTRGSVLDPTALAAWCEGRIAAFKVPRYFELVDDLPRSATKREIERSVLKTLPHAKAWDREAASGRRSAQARR